MGKVFIIFLSYIFLHPMFADLLCLLFIRLSESLLEQFVSLHSNITFYFLRNHLIYGFVHISTKLRRESIFQRCLVSMPCLVFSEEIYTWHNETEHNVWVFNENTLNHKLFDRFCQRRTDRIHWRTLDALKYFKAFSVDICSAPETNISLTASAS